MNKIFTGLMAAAAFGLSATAAQAGNVHWSIGVNLPPVATVVSNGPVYHPGYYAPAPIYYAPAPVYHAPPVVYRPVPRYYGPPAVVVHRHWGGHHQHWDHRGGRYDGRGHGRHR